MNLDQVNSPMDLILENEKTLTPLEKALQALQHKDITPKDHLEIAKKLVEVVRDFHNHVVETRDDISTQWAVDSQSLHFALCILKTVE